MALAVLCSGRLVADESFYTSRYIPSVLPSETAGTTLDPQWDIGLPSHGSAAEIVDGVLVASTLEAEDENQQFWQVGHVGSQSFGTSAAWEVDPANGVTVDFTIEVTGGKETGGHSENLRKGFAITISDGEKSVVFFFDVNGITANGANLSIINSYDNTQWRTYRITMKDGIADLYIAGEESPIISEIVGLPAKGTHRIAFGDISRYVSGSYRLKALAWNLRQATPLPPSETLPLATK